MTEGQQVTCRVERDAFYSGYAGLPKQSFRPGMVGTIAHVDSPNVRLSKCDVCGKKHDTSNVIDFEGEGVSNPKDGSKTWRVRLSRCNTVTI